MAAPLRRPSYWLSSLRRGTILSKPSVAEAIPNVIQDIHEKHVESVDANMQEIRNLNKHQGDAGILKRKPTWQPHLRHVAHEILADSPFEQVIVLMVFVQLGLAIYITDLTAYEAGQPEKEEPEWFHICNACFLSIYILELLLRVYVYRENFFECRWHTLDLFVVVIDILSEIVALITNGGGVDISVCRLLRVLRIARAGRLLRQFPEIFVMVKSLAGAFRVVLWSFVILSLLLVLWSLVAVVYIHPLNIKLPASDECKNAYATVYDTVLTFIQTVIAGDSFGLCSMPLMRAHPWTLVYFLLVLGSVAMGVMNLVLSAIVDRAAEVRQQNTELLNLARLHFYEEAKRVILKHCSSTDVHHTGLVSFENIMKAYDHTESFQDSCDTLDATRADLNTVFNMMDEDCCGSVDYTIFVDHLLRLKVDNQHSTVVLIKQQLVQMSNKILKEIENIKADMKKIVQADTDHQCSSMKETSGGNGATPETRKRNWLQLSQEKDDLILAQCSERKRQMLETMRSATKLMKDNGIYVDGFSELLVDLQDEHAIVLLACDHKISI